MKNNEYQEKQKLKVDELDLFSILKTLRTHFQKYNRQIFAIYIVGIALGIIYHLFQPKIYQSTLIVTTNLLRGSSFVIVIEELQRHISEGNEEKVAELLNISPEHAKKITSISVYSVRNFSKKELSDKITEDDAEIQDNEFLIEAKLKSNELWDELQEGLIYYLNNNEFSKKKTAEKKSNLKLVREKIRSQLSELDSLGRSITKIYAKGGGTGAGGIYMTDPSSIYNQILELYKTDLQTEIEIRDPEVLVIKSFFPYKKPYRPRLIITTSLTIFLSTLVAGIFLISKIYSRS